MSAMTLQVETRSERGKGPMRQLRITGQVPGVIYGQGKDASAVKIDQGMLRKHLRDIGKSKLVTLESGAKDVAGKSVLIREVQIDPVSNQLLHVDFQNVDFDQIIAINVNLEFVGTAAGEKAGGARDISCYKLEVDCRADSIPDSIEVNIEALEIGDLLRAGDLTFPEGVALSTDEFTTIIAIEKRRAVVEEDSAETTEDAAEGEAAEGEAEGDSEE